MKALYDEDKFMFDKLSKILQKFRRKLDRVGNTSLRQEMDEKAAELYRYMDTGVTGLRESLNVKHTRKVWKQMEKNKRLMDIEPTLKMVKEGKEFSDTLYTATVDSELGGEAFDISRYPERWQDLIQQYVDKQANVVQLIYIVMRRAEEEA